ncbi:uncharacterized protein LOC143462985 isoform X1 [Clavelina lepadiformis]|uniref:uncharacterized protein LOC143462985 isoform X1 n=1 Tax=Clavelina lepadiformis TaxID=159417 RepID=UPI0040419837
MKLLAFGTILIASTAFICDALRCFQCEIGFRQLSIFDTCIGQNATSCPDEASLCFTNTSALPDSFVEARGCHSGDASQVCANDGVGLVCNSFCATDGCNSPLLAESQLPPAIPSAPLLPLLPPQGFVPLIPPRLIPPPPGTGEIQLPTGTDIISLPTPPGVLPPPRISPTPGLEPENVGELSCFQCSIVNVDTLPFSLDECAGASPRPCPASADNYCVIFNSTEPGIHSVVRACEANISITSCSMVGEVTICAEYCSTDGCNGLEGIQNTTTAPIIGTQPPSGTGGIERSAGTDKIPTQNPTGLGPESSSELSCFQCSVVNIDALPFPLDECTGASPLPCPVSADNYCVIITSTEPGVHSVTRTCRENIITPSCSTLGQVMTCIEHCSADGCNSLEGIIQEATIASDTGTQGGGGGAARQVRVSHFAMVNVVIVLLCML